MLKFSLLLQQFFEQLWMVIASLVRVVVLSKWNVKLKKETQKRDIVILGNGPSLNKMIADHADFLEGKDKICVNVFPTTDLYQELKPEIYFASAPDMWLEDIEPFFLKQSKSIFDALATKTEWPLKLYFPYEARKFKRWQQNIKNNPNIEVIYYNNVAVEGWQWFEHLMFRKNWGMPRPHNIIIPSVFTSINLGYKKIFLWGTDHSWLKDISVNDNNDALINQKHFYDEATSKAKPLDKKGKGARKLHEILHKFMLAFKGYFILRDYADAEKAEIYNQTEGSFIDAFERKTLRNVDKH